jgi:hypothetical protein
MVLALHQFVPKAAEAITPLLLPQQTPMKKADVVVLTQTT